MNRGEAIGFGIIAGLATIVFYYSILYFLVLSNFLVVMKHLDYDLYLVETELWWAFIGVGFIFAIRTLTKTYKWARRDYCNHCGKELSKN